MRSTSGRKRGVVCLDIRVWRSSRPVAPCDGLNVAIHVSLSKDVTRAVPSTVLRHGGRDGVQPRTGHGLDSVVTPSRTQASPPDSSGVTGTMRTANESEPRTPRWVCYFRRWAWNRPYRRGAAPGLPIDTSRDWLTVQYDAGWPQDSGCRNGVGFIPALTDGAFSSILRNTIRGTSMRYSNRLPLVLAVLARKWQQNHDPRLD